MGCGQQGATQWREGDTLTQGTASGIRPPSRQIHAVWQAGQFVFDRRDDDLLVGSFSLMTLTNRSMASEGSVCSAVKKSSSSFQLIPARSAIFIGDNGNA